MATSNEEIRARFKGLGVFENGSERAPYKPLLLLYALASYRARGEWLIPFSDDTLHDDILAAVGL